jgi:hypothetical protein
LNVREIRWGEATGAPLLGKEGFPVAVTSWNPPTQVQVTVVPAAIVTFAGSKRFPPLLSNWISTALGGGGGGGGGGPPPGASAVAVN